MPTIDPVDIAQRPFWSVMIPSYNNADLLTRTLETVLAQAPGAGEMQIEVVDDASDGGDVADVVEELAQGRVGLFVQPENVGAAANFTTCVRRSIGQWVHILHSDDLVVPGFYQRYRDRIATCPDAVMVTAQTIEVDADEHHLYTTRGVPTDKGYVRDAAYTFASENPARFVSTIVARRAYEEVGGFHPDLFHANDWEMWVRLAASGPVAWVDEPGGLYRVHAESDSTLLQRSTAYLDDCLRSVDVMSHHVDAARRRRSRRAGRRHVADYALSVSNRFVEGGQFRLAILNALQAARIDPSVRTWSQALDVTRRAQAGRMDCNRLPAVGSDGPLDGGRPERSHL